MGIDHSNPYIHSTTVLCDIASCSDGQIRLREGSSENEGRVEICSNQRWETISDGLWGDYETEVACNALGYTGSYALYVLTYVSVNAWALIVARYVLNYMISLL